MTIKKQLIVIAGLFLLSLTMACTPGKKGRYERCPAFGKTPAAAESHTLKNG